MPEILPKPPPLTDPVIMTTSDIYSRGEVDSARLRAKLPVTLSTGEMTSMAHCYHGITKPHKEDVESMSGQRQNTLLLSSTRQ